ncbi:MAG: hypothetical protein ABH885_02970 [Candidatus Omnitrophota bacterium]
MILIVTLFFTGIIYLIAGLGLVENPLHISLAFFAFIVMSAVMLKHKVSCPFGVLCPFRICPLNKKDK